MERDRGRVRSHSMASRSQQTPRGIRTFLIDVIASPPSAAFSIAARSSDASPGAPIY
jgi:hypothetical protein